jgi:hypothetical protein
MIATYTASNGVTLARVGAMSEPTPRPANDAGAPQTPAARNSCPMAEAFEQGLIDGRYRQAVRWWHEHHAGRQVAEVRGMKYNCSGGNGVSFISRDPTALFAQEWAAEVSLGCQKVYHALGRHLVATVEAAMDHAEMSALAPVGLAFPKAHRALAGRIWLGAAFEIIVRFIEDGRVSQRDVWDIKKAADDAVMALAAKRRLRADNDNAPAALRVAA